MGNRGGLTLYQLQPGFIIQQFMPEGYRARAKMHAEKKMFKGVRKIWNASRICVSSKISLPKFGSLQLSHSPGRTRSITSETLLATRQRMSEASSTGR